MIKGLIAFLLIITVLQPLFSQEIVSNHNVKDVALNEFTIETLITGLNGVDIARISYYIPKEHIYKPMEGNSFFSKREDKFIKFFIMEIPSSGAITIKLKVLLSDNGNFEFPIEFQYSKAEEKKVIGLTPVVIENPHVIVVEVTTKIEDEN